MTPKEKAFELVAKCRFAIYDNLPSLHSNSFKRSMTEASKQCTLTAVDEILNVIPNNNGWQTKKEYWQDVKQEIEKL